MVQTIWTNESKALYLILSMKHLLFLCFLIAGLNSFSQDRTPERKKQFNLDNGLAIDGYDPVAYFKQNKAVKGSRNFGVHHMGVLYLFSTKENRDLFLRDASAYEPQYGGWCAYAMGSSGEKVSVDPETFKIIDGKLYLFYNKFFNNTLKSWNKDESGLKSKADVNWGKFYK